MCVHINGWYQQNNIWKQWHRSNSRCVGKLWLNEKHVEEKLGHEYLPVIINKCNPVYKKHIYELVDEPKKQPNRRFFRSDLALKVIMDCRTDEWIMKSQRKSRV